MTTTAGNACLICSQRKTKCDRAFPSCSTCIIPLAADIVQPAPACSRCRIRKKKCDRKVPSCTRCATQQVDCIYPERSKAVRSPNAIFTHCLESGEVDFKVPLPIKPRPYMRMLLHSYIETLGMNPLPVDQGSLAWLLRTSWIQQALLDPCAFHATLYSASAHVDALQGLPTTNITLYHHTMVLRFLKEKLTAPGIFSDESIMILIAPLVFFTSLSGDSRSSQVHKKALMQMIQVKSRLEPLTLSPFLEGLIAVCILQESVIHDLQFDLPWVEVPPTPLTPPLYLIYAALYRAKFKREAYYSLSPKAICIFEDIKFACEYLASLTASSSLPLSLYAHLQASWRAQIEVALSATGPAAHPTPLTGPMAMTIACHAAALIFCSLQILVDEIWVRGATEAHTWICMVGAAASIIRNDRIFFTLRHGRPVTCVQSQGASIFLESWAIYDWGNQWRKARLLVPTVNSETFIIKDPQCATF
ncbi:hypothetical protein BJX63DRAFT_424608 [Aspergillus granulosus]|uniref:Zn(2)-C6 fungal-type domain-containing protein n=1 Tax=Aspergillus granulosus TaxID=176169 RepID=A0ABR4GZ47_9EURO